MTREEIPLGPIAHLPHKITPLRPGDLGAIPNTIEKWGRSDGKYEGVEVMENMKSQREFC